MDVKTGFEGGKCAMIDHTCPPISTRSVRKKIRRSFRFAQLWGEQFYGSGFDLSRYWNESSKTDSNKMQFSVGQDTIEIQFGEDFDIVDEEPVH
jgi:hypothetical protein